jgi:hypothetical protein
VTVRLLAQVRGSRKGGGRDHDGFVRHNRDAAVAAVTVADEARSVLLADLLRRVAGCFAAGRPGSPAAR